MIVWSADAGAAKQTTAMSKTATTTVAGELDAILRTATARGEFNGSVLVARRGRILLRKGYGWSDLTVRVRNRPKTRFRISSLTNTFTAVSLLQLVARDKLRLESSVCAYLPRCPRAWQALSVSELLAGRSGIPSSRPLPPRTRSLDAWINWLRARPLLFMPGTARDRSEARQLLAGDPAVQIYPGRVGVGGAHDCHVLPDVVETAPIARFVPDAARVTGSCPRGGVCNTRLLRARHSDQSRTPAVTPRTKGRQPWPPR
jgi:hypothetical protein